MKAIVPITLILFSLVSRLLSAPALPPSDPRTEWFDEARFGLFIHWGIYAVPANQWEGKDRSDLGRGSEWLMQHVPIPVAPYRALGNQFTATNYDPVAMAQLAKAAGMRYIIITSKHHEGFALWPTKAKNAWNVMETPAKRDLLEPLVKAARDADLKIGFYYSQSQDWVNKGGAKRNPLRSQMNLENESETTRKIREALIARAEGKRDLDDGDGWDEAHKGSYDSYLQAVALPQVKELLERYSPDVLWWDTPIGMTPERVKPFIELVAEYPNMLVNDRLGGDKGGDLAGDFTTPEQYVPPTGLPGKRFEVCMTMNDSWGYSLNDNNWKSVGTILEILSDTASKGGNLLLNVGPKPDGSIPQESIERLKAVGAWMKVNGASIYGTHASPYPRQLPWGRITTRRLPDGGELLYLHIWNWPEDKKILLPALKQKPRSATLLADKSANIVSEITPEGLLLTLPSDKATDSHISVAVLNFDSPVKVDMPAFLHAENDGSFRLSPYDADRYGSTAGVMQIFGKGQEAFIGGWDVSRWRLQYRIQAPRKQSYTASIEVRSQADSALRIMVGGKTQSRLQIPSTKGEWKTLSFDKAITLRKGELSISVNTGPDWTPIEIRTLTLSPNNP